MSLNQESILSFLLDRGGKVSNSELLSHFRSLIICGGSAEKQHNRDLFKSLVNSVAVVQQQDGMKFVVVKKRYQDFVGPCTAHKDRGVSTRAVRSDSEQNNTQRLKTNGNHCSTRALRVHAESPPKRRTRSMNEGSPNTTTVKVLNISRDQTSRTRTSGPVFAVIAVKSPPRDPAEPHTHGSILPRQRGTPHSRDTVGKDSNCSSVQERDGGIESHCFTSKHTQSTQARPPNKSTRPDVVEHCESVPLEPLAHQWLVKCAAGLWGQIHALLLQDAGLAPRRDFMCGFTALHWAAKDGTSEMVHKLINIPRRRGIHVDVNSKAHGGYTPLHIAAIHQHAEVMVVLVQSYGASVTERDHSGKKALHYLEKGVSAEIRALLGGVQRKENIKEVEDENKEHSKSFHISKLFHPHTGKRQKTATKFAQEW
ncbi:ankyrin repeat domain-containing protein SOWAHA [Gouania willdenowi]|uniref:ankyrin repeat domain-containing protein SOWAHA n=1 Tax=Gouania willdenowi TaxID=441366 RepID=UPI001055090F|nr:ankyrin repeat domain-containing protein SOWAHA-like [Gouania willdenowi]